ncbi:FAD:protein FMN transferase [Leadbetterella sp. DM7]|uniref:FAD:protein FMN transferase n=1 Tax=Leadbetterella sp. DM7 TaxID=3235085 RepID=UPI00349E6C15
MGNRFVISIDEDSEAAAAEKIDRAVEEISRIERLLTTFSDSSMTSRVNAQAGVQPVEVPEEFFYLVKRARGISDLTRGAFDLSYGSIDKRLWNFDQTLTALPTAEALRNLRLINYRNIVLDDTRQTVFLKEKGMRIGFGGIGKGYAADRASRLLKELGVSNGVVNASGDLKTWGTCNGRPWTISVADPDAPAFPFSELEVGEMAVATSGTYEKYTVIDGKRYSHTINPRTGLPVSGIKSVTVICPYAELADAMATPLAVLGVDESLDLINQMKDIACIIIDDDNRLFTSKNLCA